MSENVEKLFSNEPYSEDTIQCLFFASSLGVDQVSCDKFCKKINTSIKFLSKDYLWHKDSFKVFVPVNKKNSEDSLPHLVSTTTFGDNIEDEWFIVHILLELTKEYEDLIVHIQDNDGDFLLIEAADILPTWANPETTENRVFVHKSHIHLIPPHLASLDEPLPLNEAIKHVLKSSDQTQVSSEIEEAILNRVGTYPGKIIDNIHTALVKVPVEIGALLKLQPKLIAPIVDAYCHHDVIDAKTFKIAPSNNWVTVSVKFTKCLFAMLLYSKLANTLKQQIGKDKKTILGLKLACGFQMITKKSTDIFSSKEYTKFLNTLKENGYFKNNIEGSKEYKIKLENAKEFFSAVECPLTSSVSHNINEIMTTDEYIKTKELLQNAPVCNDVEDNDDWLTIHPEQLNELLNSRYGKKTKFQKGDVLTPQNITTELNRFLKRTSDFEGIERSNSDNIENNIDFDPDQFEDCIEKMLKLLSSNNDEVQSEDSCFDEESLSEDDNDIDMELKEKLHGAADLNLNDDKSILNNMIKSMKEEKASAGPSSNLISNVGLRKTDFLDSDDDDE